MTIYQILMTKYQRLFTNDFQISTNSYVRIYKQIMQNKPNVKYAKINVSSCFTRRYAQVRHLVIQTNKAKTNPIQTQFKPMKANFSAKQTQFKPKQSQSPDSLVNHLRTLEFLGNARYDAVNEALTRLSNFILDEGEIMKRKMHQQPHFYLILTFIVLLSICSNLNAAPDRKSLAKTYVPKFEKILCSLLVFQKFRS